MSPAFPERWTEDDEDEDDGAPCCRAVVTSGNWNEHEPGCYNDREFCGKIHARLTPGPEPYGRPQPCAAPRGCSRP